MPPSAASTRQSRRVLQVFLGLLVILLAGLAAIKLAYGLGTPFPGVATPPRLAPSEAEVAIETPFPPGMVSVGRDGRVFYTYHPFHRPQDHTDHLVFEWKAGQAVPVAPRHADRLYGVFGITVDARGWLWAVRPGALERRPTEVLAIDPDRGEIVYEFTFPLGEAGFAQDLRVSRDGRWVFLADTGLFRFTSAALIVLDTQTQSFRTALVDHPSTAPQNWVMRRQDGAPYRLGFGLLNFQVGVDGLDLSPDGTWLIYAAMTHDSVYRVPTSVLTDVATTEAQVAAAVERLGPGPMSDGIAVRPDGSVVLTDVENGGLAVLDGDGALSTLLRRDDVNWADSVAVAPNGDIWFTDSRLTALLNPLGQPSGPEEMAAAAPYAIYRIPAPALR